MTLHAKPPNATHWSLRSMAAAAGLSYSSVQRIWRAHGLKPHLVETFKVSRDKNFAARVEDVVGLYLDPPDRALVFCVDEKSQIQALEVRGGNTTERPWDARIRSRQDAIRQRYLDYAAELQRPSMPTSAVIREATSAASSQLRVWA